MPHNAMLTGVLLAATLCFSVAADTIHVDDDGPNDPAPGDSSISDPNEDGTIGHPYDAIQEGVNAATFGDTVEVAAGTYEENILINKNGLTLQGAGMALSIIQGGVNSAQPVVRIANVNRTMLLTGFKITGGHSGFDELGGGIDINNASPIIWNTEVSGNTSRQLGSGIAVRGAGSKPQIYQNVIKQNNREGTAFNGLGGGIYYAGGRGLIAANEILDNESWLRGGGIYCAGSSPTVFGNLIARNFSDFDGGIAVVGDCASPTIVNNLLLDNQGDWQGGGGISVRSGRAVIINNTLAGTLPGTNGNAYGIFIDNAAQASTEARNNVIASNGFCAISAPSGTVLEYNLVFDHGQDYCGPKGPGTGSLSADPQFVDPVNGDYHLSPGSPAIDAGDPDPAFNDTDGTRNDMGAFGGPGIPIGIDRDQDGLSDDDEELLGTDPLDPDTDDDRVLDGEEVNLYATNPLNEDTDGDLADDGTEIEVDTDPLSADLTPEFTIAMDFATLTLRAFNLSQEVFVQPAVQPIPVLDPPLDGKLESEGLVFQEELAIQVSNVDDQQDFFVKATPRAALNRQKIILYVDDDGDGVFDLKTYPYIDADYSSSEIVPAIDPELIPIAGKVISKAIIGHRQPNPDGGDDFPQFFDFGANGFVRFNGWAPQTVGASYRVAAHNVFSPDEDFPFIRELYVTIVDLKVTDLLGLVDSEGFTGAVSFAVSPCPRGSKEVDSMWYLRRDIRVAEEPETSLASAFSSLFWMDENDTPRDPTDEAHDTDFVVVGFDTDSDAEVDTFLDKQLSNPPDPGQIVITDFGDLQEGDQVYWALENRDRDPENYAAFKSAMYHLRASYSVELIDSDIEISVHLHEQHTDSEFNDNIVVLAAIQQDLLKAKSLQDGIHVAYRTTAFYPNACPWDLDNDSMVGVTDFLFLLSLWGQECVPADFDCDGVGITDLLELLLHWGSCQ